MDSGVKSDEALQLLEQVEVYKSEYKKFSDGLYGCAGSVEDSRMGFVLQNVMLT